MINKDDGPRRVLLLGDSLESAERARAHHEALLVLRSSIETAHIDAYSDVAWPQEVVSHYERALSIGRDEVVRGARSANGDPGMGIDIDVRNDAEFEMLLALAPYTIHAEGWRQGQQIFSVGDTGTALWVAVTRQQEADLMSRLRAYGIPSTAFTVAPE
ncbi:hypothetical protein GTW40_23675 [Streptomyces sp. SID4985]|uniref:hypothetical protein n=1 Tax=Streptomyces sp. SID4985 TaxID=2690292 RepID=UPI001371D6CF|nr:hypothetical protein [Streptomyces sp. SID4985]MYQ48009.1 hypothetical protein [Streptomyces sp. SID4985]